MKGDGIKRRNWLRRAGQCGEDLKDDMSCFLPHRARNDLQAAGEVWFILGWPQAHLSL